MQQGAKRATPPAKKAARTEPLVSRLPIVLAPQPLGEAALELAPGQPAPSDQLAVDEHQGATGARCWRTIALPYLAGHVDGTDVEGVGPGELGEGLLASAQKWQAGDVTTVTRSARLHQLKCFPDAGRTLQSCFLSRPGTACMRCLSARGSPSGIRSRHGFGIAGLPRRCPRGGGRASWSGAGAGAGAGPAARQSGQAFLAGRPERRGR